MVFDFLQPISTSVEEYIATLSNQTLGKKVVFHTQTDFPVLDNIAIAIITVNEFRGSEKDNDDFSFDYFRKQFYSLFPGNWNASIVDLGSIEAGASIEDTYFVVKSLIADFPEVIVAIYNIFAPVTYFKWLVGKVSGGDDTIADYIEENREALKHVLDVIGEASS